MFLRRASLTIHGAGFATVGKNWSSREFYYPYNILYFVTRGGAKLILEDETILLEPEHIYLLSGLSFRETICSDLLEHHFVHFQAKLPFYENAIELYQHPKFLKVSNVPELITLFQGIHESYQLDDHYGYYRSIGSLQVICAPFFQHVASPKREILRFIDVLTYIDHHIHEKIYIGELAKMMSLEPTYFTHLFTTTFGLSPKQYVIKKRLERAQILLTQTNLTTKHIAQQLGFDNEMYFSRLFRNKMGMPPRDYRQLVQ